MSIGRRPLLGALSLLPFVGAGAVAVSSHGSPGLRELIRPEEAAQPGALTRWTEGPLTVPDEVLGSGQSDDDFRVIPPSTAVGVSAIALEEDSSLLFGRVSSSTTRQDAQGDPLAPSIELVDEDGGESTAPPTELGYGALGLLAPDLEAGAQVTLAAADGSRPVGDAVQTTLTETGDFRSLSLSRMLSPRVDASFLGAGTLRGSTSVLVLRNVSPRPATASVQVWTADGPAEMQGRSRIVVAAGETAQLLLDTVIAGQDAVGLRVVTVGAPLLMHVSTAERDGLTARGAQILAPLPEPAAEQLVPGVHLTTPDLVPVLILQNPRGTDTSADVTVLGSEGDLGLPGLSGLDLPAGTVLTVPLPLTVPGDYAVRILAAAPVDAVVRSRVPGPAPAGETLGTPADLALAAAAPALGQGAALALSTLGPVGLLALVSSADTTATVIPLGADGSAGAPVVRPVPAGRLVTVGGTELRGMNGAAAGLVLSSEGSGRLHAAWVQAEHDPALGGLLSTIPVLPPARELASLSVHLR
ncbi:DUF5719 family protein [Brachybacterium hainanense]|uniref:DUF5719 family protein n=1 Tax=Brachybacterium hainanense TaxID=1541174 RepID=A0ABV6RCH9_9MICO